MEALSLYAKLMNEDPVYAMYAKLQSQQYYMQQPANAAQQVQSIYKYLKKSQNFLPYKWEDHGREGFEWTLCARKSLDVYKVLKGQFKNTVKHIFPFAGSATFFSSSAQKVETVQNKFCIQEAFSNLYSGTQNAIVYRCIGLNHSPNCINHSKTIWMVFSYTPDKKMGVLSFNRNSLNVRVYIMFNLPL